MIVEASSGEIVYWMHGMETMGLYGVNRDSKTINYFKQIHLPSWLALTFLYGIAVAEVVLGLMFLMIFVKSLLPRHPDHASSLFGTRTLHCLAFKGSIFIFMLFATGDILFGDRTELWEHGTFFIMVIVSYYLYVQHDVIEAEEEKKIAEGE